ncbi:MAG: DUF262 domain-containing protein [Ruminococcus sp.]|nr:DUF262 domain-containing protein [Ruminococcus sp.]
MNINTLIVLLEEYDKIEVPRVQRDYVQGRKDEHSTMVRKNLLNDIQCAFETDAAPLNLSFIYGKEMDKKFYPVDGQQRLTTLFLLHIYAFAEDNNKTDLLKRFSYEARTTTRDFFIKLVEHRKEIFSETALPSSVITDTAWFIEAWKYDPSVKHALTMLDAIVEQNFNLNNLKIQLEERENPKVLFQFLSMEDFGMEDNLYIKLNARGRPLTAFENFKSKFTDKCPQKCPALCDEIKDNLDGKWADLFWSIGEDNFDIFYLAFFEIIFSNSKLIQTEPNKPITKNWIYGIDYNSISNDIYTTVRNTLNYLTESDSSEAYHIIEKALHTPSQYTHKVLFYAVSKFLSDEPQPHSVNKQAFEDWIRVIKNLVNNSRIEEKEHYLNSIDSIDIIFEHKNNLIEYLASGALNSLPGFNKEQFLEECSKAVIMHKGSTEHTAILEAEKKLPYFNGQIRAALYYSNLEQSNDITLFNNYVDKISIIFDKDNPVDDNLLRRALLTIGDYTLGVGRYKTLCIYDPNENSRTPSLKRLFSNHGEIVKSLLDSLDSSRNLQDQLKQIIQNSNVPQNDWRYCFIEYPSLFGCMKPAHLRILDNYREMLLIPNKSSSGKNYSLYLQTLQIRLVNDGIYNYDYHHDEGADGDRYLTVEDTFNVRFSNGHYIIYDTHSDKEIWRSSTVDLIDETLSYIKTIV